MFRDQAQLIGPTKFLLYTPCAQRSHINPNKKLVYAEMYKSISLSTLKPIINLDIQPVVRDAVRE